MRNPRVRAVAAASTVRTTLPEFEGRKVPTAWRSALPALGYPLPDDRSPASTDRRAVTVNVPLRLIRQAITPTEYWDIPLYKVFRQHVLKDGMDVDSSLQVAEQLDIPAYIQAQAAAGLTW